MSVLETKPADAVSVIECDLNVDFAPPVGYKEPERQHVSKMADEEDEPMNVEDLLPEPTGFVAFGGSGVRLDGKKKRTSSESEPVKPKIEYVRGIPDYDYEVGFLKFIRNSKPKVKNGDNADSKNGEEGGGGSFEAFKGEGKSLRQSKK